MLTIKHENGYFVVKAGERREIGPTLERALEKLEPGAPAEKLAAAAEILEPHVGAPKTDIHHGIVSA